AKIFGGGGNDTLQIEGYTPGLNLLNDGDTPFDSMSLDVQPGYVAISEHNPRINSSTRTTTLQDINNLNLSLSNVECFVDLPDPNPNGFAGSALDFKSVMIHTATHENPVSNTSAVGNIIHIAGSKPATDLMRLGAYPGDDHELLLADEIVPTETHLFQLVVLQ